MQCGWHGKVLDTLRSLYNKTSFRVKQNGLISSPVNNHMGVNQGGVANGLLFRKYMCDLDNYLKKQHGICIGQEIIAHLLWADDLVLMSDSPHGLQEQLNGLYSFCKNNLMIVNEIKTKCMTIGKCDKIKLEFNNKPIEEVDQYKYLGVLLKSIRRSNDCIFNENPVYLCEKANKALFAMLRKVKYAGSLPPRIMFYLFESLVKPILTYGSDVWGYKPSLLSHMDRAYKKFLKYTLHIKANTSDLMVYGESGCLPPSIDTTIYCVKYLNRLFHMSNDAIAKQVFLELDNMHQLGFPTSLGILYETVNRYKLDIAQPCNVFAKFSKNTISEHFILEWHNEMMNTEKHPILRTYRDFKFNFTRESYLDCVPQPHFRHAISRFRTSSHDLQIEKGRHCKPKLAISKRLCGKCNVIEDEKHFLLKCNSNIAERADFFGKISKMYPVFESMMDEEKFVFIMTATCASVLTLLGKFLFRSFKLRKS